MRRVTKLGISVLVGTLAGVLVAVGILAVHHAGLPPETDLHTMLHRAVPLDSNEAEILDAREKAFLARRAEIEARLRVANGQLADAIARNPAWSPDVEAATKEVEAAAADLQRATLVHVFEMRAGLKPEHRPAYDKVLIEALRRGAP